MIVAVSLRLLYPAPVHHQPRLHRGLATNYAPGPLTGDNTHMHLAVGYEPGRRFPSAEVIRLADAKKVHLGHTHKTDARWRLYAFADAVDPRNPASRLNTLMDFLAGPNSPRRGLHPAMNRPGV